MGPPDAVSPHGSTRRTFRWVKIRSVNGTVLVTGAAGFVGSHVAAALARAGHEVVGCDSFAQDLCPPRLKRDRVTHLLDPAGVPCLTLDLAEEEEVRALFERYAFSRVVHLAAQAGVRHSMDQPRAFVRSNLVAFANVLEACRHADVEHLVYASSSSIYGAREAVPFRESDRADAPASLYAATKRADELMAYAYAHLYRMPCTALRFFTVYGPWGRPDMAYFEFAQRIRRGDVITLYDRGVLRRDFTYVDDIVEGVRRVAEGVCAAAEEDVPHAVFNIGHQHPVPVTELVHLLEAALGRTALVRHAVAARSEVPVTCADTSRLEAFAGFTPSTPLAEGLRRFVRWLEAWDPLPGAREAGAPARP